MRPQWNRFALKSPPTGAANHGNEPGSLPVKEAALLFETFEDNPDSKPWHPLLTLSICLAGAFAARMLVHWSSVALANAIRNAPVESVPNTLVEKGGVAR